MPKQLNVNLAFTADTTQAKRQLQDLQNQLTKLTSLSGTGQSELRITKEIQQATTAATQLQIQLKNATNVNTGKLDLSKFINSMNQSNTSLKQYQQQLSSLGSAGDKAFASLATSISNAEMPLRRSNTLLSELWVTMQNTMRWQLSSTALHAFVGAIQTAYGYAKDLDKSLTNIRVVSGQSATQMQEFAQRANAAAQSLSTTTKAYTDAALIFYQQGLNDKAVEERTNAVIKMAQVTGDAAEDVSSYMTAIWNNFDDGTVSLESYADAITALGASTASSSSEIAAGLQQFAAIAKTTGLSYEYATSALATLVANTRQSADTIGNSLKTIFSRLQGLSLGETLDDGVDLNKYSSALAKVGVQVIEANGSLRDADSILDDLANKWEDLSSAQQMALAQTLAGVRQYSQLISLMNNWDDMQTNLETVNNSAGTLEKQQEIYEQSWEASAKRVRAAWEEIWSALIDDSFFKNLNDGLATALKGVNAFIEGIGGLKPLLLSIGGIFTSIFQKQIAQSLSDLGTNLRTLVPGQASKMRQEMVGTKIKANELVANMYADKDTSAGLAQYEAYKAQGEAQILLINNASRMSELEMQIGQALNDQTLGLAEEVKQSGELLENTEQQVNAMARLAGITTGNEGQDFNFWKDTAKGVGTRGAIDSALRPAMAQVSAGSMSNEEFSQSYAGQIHQTIEDLKQGFASLNEDLAATVGSAGYAALEDLFEATREGATDVNAAKDAWDQWTQVMERTPNITRNLNQWLDNLVQNNRMSRQEADQFRTALLGQGEATVNTAMHTSALGHKMEELKIHIQNSKGEMQSFSQSFTALGSSVMSISSLSSSFLNLKSSLEQGNLSATQLLSTFGSLAMQIPRLVSNAIMHPISTAIGAVVSLGITVGTYLYNNWKKTTLEYRLERAKEVSNQLSEQLQSTKQEAENLANSFETYIDLVQTLEDCTKNTEEWREALSNVNNEVMELITQYPELAQYVSTTEDGQLQISDEGRTALLEAKQRSVALTQAAQIQSQKVENSLSQEEEFEKLLNKIGADSESIITGFIKENQNNLVDIFSQDTFLRDYEDYLKSQADNMFDLTGGTILGDVSDFLQTVKQAFSQASAYISNLSEDEFNQFYEGKTRAEARDELYQNHLGAIYGEENLRTILDFDPITLQSQLHDSGILDSLSDYKETVEVNTASTEKAMQAYATTILNNNEELQESGHIEEASNLFENKFTSLLEEEIQKLDDEGFGKKNNRESNFQDYAKAKGLTGAIYTGYDSDTDSFKYKIGETESSISAAAAEYVIAVDNVTESTNTYADSLAKLFNKANEKEYNNFALSAVGNTDVSNYTRKELEDLQEDNVNYYNILDSIFGDGKDGKLSRTTLDNLGVSDMDELVEKFSDTIKATAESFNDITDDWLNDTQNFLKKDSIKNFVDNLDIDFYEQFGSRINKIVANGDYTALEGIEDFFKTINDYSNEVYDAFLNLDWNNTSLGEVNEILKEVTNTQGDKLNLDEFYLIRDLFAETSTMDFSSLYSLAEGLTDKGTIKASDYEELSSEYQSYFQLMLDGTYQLTVSAKEFQESVRQAQQESFKDNINKNIEEISNFNSRKQDYNENYDSEKLDVDNYDKGNSAALDSIIQAQADFLQKFAIGNEDALKLAEEVSSIIENSGEVTLDQAENLREYVQQIIKTYENEGSNEEQIESVQQNLNLLALTALSEEELNSLLEEYNQLNIEGIDIEEARALGLKSINEELTSIYKKLSSGIKIGDTISDEEYERLKASGSNLISYFRENAEGSYTAIRSLTDQKKILDELASSGEYTSSQIASLCTSEESLHYALEQGYITRQDYLDWLNVVSTSAEAATNNINQQYGFLMTFQSALSSLSQSMSANDLLNFKDSSGIDWGENGIMQFSEFSNLILTDYEAAMKYIEGMEEATFTSIRSTTEKELQEAKTNLEELQQQREIALNAEDNLFGENAPAESKFAGQTRDEYLDTLDAQIIQTTEDVETLQTKADALDFEKMGDYISNLDTDVDTSTFNDLTEAYMDLSDAVDENTDYFTQWEEAADKAVRDLRINDAIEDLADNWEDYTKILNKVQSAETKQEKVMEANADGTEAFKETMADLLDTSEEFIDADLMDAIDPQDLYDAANGSEEAVGRIRDAFIDTVAAAYDCEDEVQGFKDTLSTLSDGATIDINDYPFLQKLISASLAAGATADDIENMLSGLSIDCDVTGLDEAALAAEDMANNIITAADTAGQEVVNDLSFDVTGTGDTQEQTGITEEIGYTERIIPNPTFTAPVRTMQTPFSEPLEYTMEIPSADKVVVPDISEEETKKVTPLAGVKIENAKYNAGGNINKSNKGNAASPRSSGRGGSGRGRNPRSSSRRTATRQNKEKLTSRDIKGDKIDLKDELKRYRQIDNTIDDINEKIEDYSEVADRAFGKSRVEALNKEAKAMINLASTYKKKLSEIKDYIEEDKLEAQNYKWTFDTDGNVSNYKERQTELVAEYNAAQETYLKQYNKAVDWWNKLSAEDQEKESNKTKYEDKIKAAENARDDAKEYYEKAQAALDQVEEDNELYEDTYREWKNTLLDAFDTAMETIDYTFEVKIDIDDAEIKYLEYLLGNLGDTASSFVDQIANLGKQVPVYESQFDAAQSAIRETLLKYSTDNSDYDDTLGQLGYTALDKTLVEKIASGGEITEEDKAAILKAGITEETINSIRNYQDQMYESADAMKELRDDVLAKTIDAFEEYTEEIDRNSQKIEHLQKVTETYKNIIDIVGKKVLDASGELSDSLNQANFEMQRNNTHALKSELDFIDSSIAITKEKLETLQANNLNGIHDTAIAQLEQDLKDMEDSRDSTYESWLDSWEAEMQAAADIYTETLENIMDTFSDSVAGLMGSLDELSEAYERKNEADSVYLDDYDKIYQLSKLTRDIENSIDDTDNINSKKALKSLLKDINELEEDGVELSQYDIDNARRRYELELAKARLQEAQNAKSQVKMTRDSEGNYGYVYTADSSSVADAEQNYEDKLYAMQQANAEYINELQGSIISAEQACQDALAEMDASQFASYEEYQAAIAEVQADYAKLIDGYSQQLEEVLDNNKVLYENDWREYSDATDYKISSNENYIDSFEETQLSLLTGYNTIEDMQNAFNQATEDATNDMIQAWDKWYENTQIALSDGGTSIQDYGKTVTEEVIPEVLSAAEEAEQSAEDLATTYEDSFSRIMDAVEGFCNQYDTMIDRVINKNTQLQTAYNSLVKIAANLSEDSDNSSSSSSSEEIIISEETEKETSASRSRRRSARRSRSGSGKKSTSTTKNTGSRKKPTYEDQKKIAAAIWILGGNASGWGNDPERKNKLASVGATRVQDYINNHARNGDIYSAYNGIRSTLQSTYTYSNFIKKFQKFDTGGYTGDWGNSDGRLALLHQKELVLNSDDTENMLKAVDLIREISNAIDLNALSASSNGFASLFSSMGINSDNSQNLQQTVTIAAEFPNATNRSEIEAAFDNLVNRAAQFANRKNS